MGQWHAHSSFLDICRFTIYLFFSTPICLFSSLSVTLTLTLILILLSWYLNLIRVPWTYQTLVAEHTLNLFSWVILTDWKHVLGVNSVHSQTLHLLSTRGWVFLGLSCSKFFSVLSFTIWIWGELLTSFNPTNHWICAFSLNLIFLLVTNSFPELLLFL